MPLSPSIPASPQLTGETISPDLIDSTVARLPSPESRRSYRLGITDLTRFAGRRTITARLLHKWRDDMARRLKPASVNVRVAAAKKLFQEAQRDGLIAPAQAWELCSLSGLKRRGQNAGNWLTREQCRAMLDVPNRRSLKGKRAYCVLAILLGCGLRRTELAELQVEQIQSREGRWVFADVLGKGGRLRTVAIPAWVKEAIDGWTKAAAITSGDLMRQLNLSSGLSTESLWSIVQKAGAAIGVPNFSPHDLRRTCAKLCRSKGGRIEQIQAMLGHASIATTERYLGTTQDLRHAVNDDLGLWT